MNTNKPLPSKKSGSSSKSNWVFKGLFLLLILSRLLFLSRYPFFYDAPEYLHLANLPTFTSRLAASHQPNHPLYLLLIGFFNSPFKLSLLSALFGLGGIGVFLLLIRKHIGKNLTMRALPFLILCPQLWLIHTNILHESIEQFFFLGALYFLSQFSQSRKLWHLVLFNFSLFLSLFTFLGIAVLFPAILVLAYFLSPYKRLPRVLFLAFNLAVLTTLTLLIYRLILPSSHFGSLTRDYLFNNYFPIFHLLNLLRAVRNSLWLLWFNFTPLSIYLLVISFIRSFRQKKYWLVAFLITTTALFIFTCSFWYGGLYGRFGSWFVYPLTLSAMLFLSEKEFSFATGAVFLFFLSTIWQYQQLPLPTQQMALIKKISNWEKSYFVISDYQRPQLEYEGLPKKNTLIILDNDQANSQTLAKIEHLIAKKQPIYFTEQSLTFPYLQYDGQALHPIGRNRSPKAKLYHFNQTHQFLLVKSNHHIQGLNIWLLSTGSLHTIPSK